MVDDLIARLDEAVSLLRSVKETFWSQWLAENLHMVQNRNFRGVERLLGGFGGMGSFNDLVIHPINGHEVQEHQMFQVNERLDFLRAELSRLALRIKHEVEK